MSLSRKYLRLLVLTTSMAVVLLSYQNCDNGQKFGVKPSPPVVVVVVPPVEISYEVTVSGGKRVNTTQIKTLDWDQDGSLDALFTFNRVATGGSGNLASQICFNFAEDTFSDCHDFNTQGEDISRVSTVSVGDFDNDGDTDFIEFTYVESSDPNPNLGTIVYNDGVRAGVPSYHRETFYGGVNTPSAFLAGDTGDFDLDGWPDLAYVDSVTKKLTVQFGFARPEGLVSLKEYNLPNTIPLSPADPNRPELFRKVIAIRAANLDLDSSDEIVVINDRYEDHYIIKVTPSSDDLTLNRIVDHDRDSMNIYTLQIADINSDGFKDLILPDNSLGSIIYWGSGNLNFTRQILENMTSMNGSYPADINADGIADLVWIREAGNQSHVSVQYGLGDSLFQDAIEIAIIASTNVGLWQPIAFDDLNNDAYPDMIIGTAFEDVVLMSILPPQ